VALLGVQIAFLVVAVVDILVSQSINGPLMYVYQAARQFTIKYKFVDNANHGELFTRQFIAGMAQTNAGM
jgi:hypothetical protein